MELNEPPVADVDSTGNEVAQPMDAPPTMQEQSDVQMASTWSKVIGIISIILGGLGALSALWQIIAPFLMGTMGAFFSKMNPQGADPFIGMKQWQIPMVIVGVGLLGIAIMLLIGGVQVLSNKQAGMVMLKRWAFAKIGFSVIAIAVGMMTQMAQMQAAMDQANTSTPGSGAVAKSAMMIGMVIGLFFGIAWAWAYPIFILFWFNKKNIREEISTWESSENSDL